MPSTRTKTLKAELNRVQGRYARLTALRPYDASTTDAERVFRVTKATFDLARALEDLEVTEAERTRLLAIAAGATTITEERATA
ncbi:MULTISPECIES: hypothetical protein [Actinomycetes]|uniref:hypothetical protein n=1 Tax=Actinomycetes TaxID=1760 RepID=UPI000AFF3319|nr:MULTISPECIES: hypothetical protein [Actinomycetes]